MVLKNIIIIIALILFTITITLKTIHISELSIEKYKKKYNKRNRIITVLSIFLFFISIFYFSYIRRLEILETLIISNVVLISSLPESKPKVLIDTSKIVTIFDNNKWFLIKVLLSLIVIILMYIKFIQS